VPRAQPPLRSGVILAGGRSSRIGAPKALLDLAGEPLLRHVARALVPACDELIVVAAPESAQAAELRDGLAQEVRLLARRWRTLHGTARPDRLRPRVRLLHDERPHLGPVSGLASALAAARGAIVFVAACDIPFVAPRLVAALLARAEAVPASDVVVPRWNGYLEPLLTVYRTATMAPHYARQLVEGELRPTARLGLVRVDVVDEDTLRALDPRGRSFVNLNAREDYAAARALVEAAATAPGSRPARSRKGSSADG
jgi:molybdopterin-guanine dinucleotide biosynthesis protein A